METSKTYLRVCRLPFVIFERNVRRIQHELQPIFIIFDGDEKKNYFELVSE